MLQWHVNPKVSTVNDSVARWVHWPARKKRKVLTPAVGSRCLKDRSIPNSMNSCTHIPVDCPCGCLRIPSIPIQRPGVEQLAVRAAAHLVHHRCEQGCSHSFCVLELPVHRQVVLTCGFVVLVFDVWHFLSGGEGGVAVLVRGRFDGTGVLRRCAVVPGNAVSFPRVDLPLPFHPPSSFAASSQVPSPIESRCLEMCRLVWQ